MWGCVCVCMLMCACMLGCIVIQVFGYRLCPGGACLTAAQIEVLPHSAALKLLSCIHLNVLSVHFNFLCHSQSVLFTHTNVHTHTHTPCVAATNPWLHPSPRLHPQTTAHCMENVTHFIIFIFFSDYVMNT